jgi:hypothetical protein
VCWVCSEQSAAMQIFPETLMPVMIPPYSSVITSEVHSRLISTFRMPSSGMWHHVGLM